MNTLDMLHLSALKVVLPAARAHAAHLLGMADAGTGGIDSDVHTARWRTEAQAILDAVKALESVE
jgi:hypothetical protein